MHCPVTKVNISRFLLTAIVGFAFVFSFDFLIHQNLLIGYYEQTMNLWRPPAEMQSFMPYMFAYQALLVVIVEFIYTRNHDGKGITEGLRFGLQIGILLALLNAAAYIWMPLPKELALGWAASGLGTGLGLGIIFSLLYKK